MSIPITPAQMSRGIEPDEQHNITAQQDADRKRSQNLKDVKRIIGIHSGKGGVGKTFLTVNIAYTLAEQGLAIGILDGDVDCPNIPTFLKLHNTLYVNKEKQFQPVTHRGIKLISTGFTKEDQTQPFLIRGPAKHRVAIDFLTNTNWGELDILFIDLPPGTSDVPMSYLEFGGLSGIIYITSPQKEALIDTEKSIQMGKTFAINPIGIIENMTGTPFGEGKAQLLAIEFSIPYLGNIPLNQHIYELNEAGDIAFLDPSMKEIIQPLLNAIKSHT